MKRATLCIVFFLLLGAIVNIAVAWGFSMKGTPSEVEVVRGLSREHPPAWFFQEFTKSGFRRLSVQVLPDARPPFDSLLQICGVIDAIDLTASSRFHVPPPVSISHVYLYQRDAAGWPLLSVNCEREGKYDTMSSIYVDGTITGGFVIQPLPPNTTDYWRDRSLPFAPHWPGFAINTIFYAAILWLLTLAPFTARRIIRRRQGRCIRCGYDLRHADHRVCPECGATP